jgi:hypothetical protein
MTRKSAIVLAAVVVVVGCGCRRNGVVFDGFEGPDLSKYRQSKKFLPGAVEIQSSVVRAGSGAARIALRPGDQIPQEEGSELERAELLESKRLWPVEESAYEYSFSLFVPQDFPITSTRLVIAQWKHRCPVEECTPSDWSQAESIPSLCSTRLRARAHRGRARCAPSGSRLPQALAAGDERRTRRPPPLHPLPRFQGRVVGRQAC